MFVSAYSTYINTNNSQKIARDRIENSKTSIESFESKLSQESVLESKNTQNIPINYISNYKAFNNKQKLYEQIEDSAKREYKQTNAMNNAKVAYEDNSKMFSLFLEPKATQSQIPQVDKKLPREIQILQEKTVRHTMVNTYLANERYYQITA